MRHIAIIKCKCGYEGMGKVLYDDGDQGYLVSTHCP